MGDVHVGNIGAFDDGADEVVFDLNDYDESVLADYQLDLWRLAVSVELLGREQGLSGQDVEAAVSGLMAAYRATILETVSSDVESGRRRTVDTTSGALQVFLQDTIDSNSRVEMLDKWSPVSAGGRGFDFEDDRLAPLSAEDYVAMEAALVEYGDTLRGALPYDPAYFQVKDIAHRLGAGVGSYGTPRFYILIEGATGGDDDDRILDVKEQGTPAAGSAVAARVQVSTPAERVALGARGLSSATNPHRGWLTFQGGSFSVTERSPWKEDFPLEDLTSGPLLLELAQVWGAVLADAHARADNDFESGGLRYSFEAELAPLIEGDNGMAFDAVGLTVAREYADQAEADYAVFLDWVQKSQPPCP
jgi:uncharacterized protein (DUF2252 family)